MRMEQYMYKFAQTKTTKCLGNKQTIQRPSGGLRMRGFLYLNIICDFFSRRERNLTQENIYQMGECKACTGIEKFPPTLES